jgi:hypothetical protein
VYPRGGNGFPAAHARVVGLDAAPFSAYSERMTDRTIDLLYRVAEAANRLVPETSKAYHDSAYARSAAFKALRDAGESAAAIGRRLGMSRNRVSQIVDLAKKVA